MMAYDLLILARPLRLDRDGPLVLLFEVWRMDRAGSLSWAP
jgi:hypothetical protein